MAVPRFIADEIPFRRVLSLGRERIVGRAAWRIFRFVGLFSVCVFAVVSRGFPAGSCCRNENVLPAASRAGFRIPAVGDRRFVGLFGGLLAFIRFFLPKVLRCRLTDGFRSWNCGQAMRLPYARRGNDGRRRVLSRNRPRLFCAMVGLAPCPFLVQDRFVRTCFPKRNERRIRMPRHLSFTSFSGTA